MCPDAEIVLRAFSTDASTNTCCPSSVATRRNVPQPGQAPNNPITEKDDPYQMCCLQPGGAAAGREREKARAKPSLTRLPTSVFQLRPVSKMDALSLNKATFPSSPINTVLSVLLTSTTHHCLPPSGSGSEVCLPFIPAPDTREQTARSTCCVRPGQEAAWTVKSRGGLGALGSRAVTPHTTHPPRWVSCGAVLTHPSPPSPATEDGHEDPGPADILPGHVR